MLFINISEESQFEDHSGELKTIFTFIRNDMGRDWIVSGKQFNFPGFRPLVEVTDTV